MAISLMDMLTRQIVDKQISVEAARRIVLNRAELRREQRLSGLRVIDRKEEDALLEKINAQGEPSEV